MAGSLGRILTGVVDPNIGRFAKLHILRTNSENGCTHGPTVNGVGMNVQCVEALGSIIALLLGL